MSVKKSKGIANAMIATIILLPLIGFGLSYAMLQPSINGLQTSTTKLQTDVTGLQTSLSDLQEAYLTAGLKDDKLSSTYSHNLKGTVINFGSETAYNITITVKWYLQGASFHQEIITIESLAGRSLMDISFSYVFGGSADDLSSTIVWD